MELEILSPEDVTTYYQHKQNLLLYDALTVLMSIGMVQLLPQQQGPSLSLQGS